MLGSMLKARRYVVSMCMMSDGQMSTQCPQPSQLVM
jgi:hypothetical protein